MSVTVRDQPDESRYEVYDGDDLAGFAAYRLGRHQIAFTHTETDEAYAGRGLAKQLVSEALDDARHRGLAVLPFCSFVNKVIAEDAAAYLDLVPEKDRERFGLPGAAG